MAYLFVKFPKKFLDSEEWQKPRKYSKAEALLYLLNESKPSSIGQYAKVWQWSKSTVSAFLEKVSLEHLAERLPNTLPNDCRTAKTKKVKELQGSAERLPNDCRTDNIRDKEYYPPILSSTKVESNIVPPRGMESNFLQEVCEEFREIVEEWFAYKQERREAYKSHRSKQAFFTKLKTLSQNNPTIAREIIHQSMANNWAGIFQLKNQTYDQKSAANQTSDTESRIANVLRAAAEGYARANTPQEWQS